ncbi:hypothetical protein T03_4420, partial [Trichinella britovi]
LFWKHNDALPNNYYAALKRFEQLEVRIRKHFARIHQELIHGRDRELRWLRGEDMVPSTPCGV